MRYAKVSRLYSCPSLLLFVGIAFVPAPRAEAAGNNLCRLYVDWALSEEAAARNNGCGFSGSRWSQDFLGHLFWCLASRQDSVQNEAVGRLRQLNDCRRIADAGGFCSQYAENAIRANAVRNAIHCGNVLTGARYSDDRQGHLNWCNTANQESLDEEVRGRLDDFNRCPSQ
jgi:hypothetical protein